MNKISFVPDKRRTPCVFYAFEKTFTWSSFLFIAGLEQLSGLNVLPHSGFSDLLRSNNILIPDFYYRFPFIQSAGTLAAARFCTSLKHIYELREIMPMGLYRENLLFAVKSKELYWSVQAAAFFKKSAHHNALKIDFYDFLHKYPGISKNRMLYLTVNLTGFGG